MRKLTQDIKFLVKPLSGKDLIAVYRFDGQGYQELFLNSQEFISLLNTNQGATILLQVNGTDNVIQSKLNLEQGTGITITDLGTGTVKIDAIPGVTVWGTITGTITNQTDLITYLSANYYPSSNPSGFITSAALAPYLTSATAAATYLTITNAAATYVPLTRNITIQGVTQNLSADRIWTFPNQPLKGGHYIEQTFTSNVGPINILWIPTVNKVYCANHANNTITIYNATTGELTNTLTLAGATNLFHVKLIGTPEIWAVGTTAASVISRINITATPGGESITGTYTGFGTIVSANQPSDFLEFSSTKAYISQYGSNSIAVVNPSTGALTATIAAVGTNPIGLANNTNGASLMNGRVLVGTVGGVTVINESTNAITALNVNPSSLLDNVRYIKYIPSLDIYAVASGGNQRLVFLQPATATTFTVIATIRGLNVISDIYIDESQNLCYVSHCSGQQTTNVFNLNITAIDLNTFQVLQTVYGNITGGTGSYRSKISVDPASRRFFATMLNNIANSPFIKIKY